MNAAVRGLSRSATNSREGRLLALFDGRVDAAGAIGTALHRHGAESIAIESEWVDGLQAIRATWPIAHAELMGEAWMHSVVAEIGPRAGERVRVNLGTTRRVGIFVSKTAHCLAELLHRNFAGELLCEISFVASNHEDCRPLAELYGIPFHYFDTRSFPRDVIEAEQLGLAEAYDVHLIVLARYMQILSPAFVDRYPGRIINIHHSLLPAFVGADPYSKALARGVKFIGATAHYVTAELDAGPIIEQEIERVTHRLGVADLRARGAELERTALSRAVELHVQDRVLAVSGRVVIFDGHTSQRLALPEGVLVDSAMPSATAANSPAWENNPWLTTEWPLYELHGALPEVFNSATAPMGEVSA